MYMKFVKYTFLLLFLSLITSIANISFAKEKVKNSYIMYNNKTFFISASYGFAFHKASYNVSSPPYFTHPFMSRLVYQSSMIPTLSFNFGFRPTDNFTLQLDFDCNIQKISGKNSLNDYDWRNPDNDNRTHWSHHTLLAFRDINVDLALKYNLLSFGEITKYGRLIIGVMAGFQYNYTQWKRLGRGGHFEYPTDWGGTYDRAYVKDWNKGLWFTMHKYLPYYGIFIDYQYKRFQIIGSFKHSLLNYISDEDQHRDTGIVDRLTQNTIVMSNAFDISINLGIIITENIKVFVKGTLRKVNYNMSTPDRYTVYGRYDDEGHIDYSVDLHKVKHYQSESIESISYIISCGLAVAF